MTGHQCTVRPRVRRAIARAALLLILQAGVGAGARAELRVFEPRHADPESLLPVVQPLLGPGESASVHGGTLVVNAGAGTLRRIDELLPQLDRPLRNLLISVRQGGSAAGPGNGVPLGSGRRISTRADGGENSVRALEGRPVLVRAGALVPLADEGYWGAGVRYEEVSEGFVVRARLAGDRVLLDIETRSDRLEGGAVRTGALHTSVSGNRGEWIAVGGSRAGSDPTGAAPAVGYSTRGNAADLVEVRVEVVE